jgi:hypothetical protein
VGDAHKTSYTICDKCKKTDKFSFLLGEVHKFLNDLTRIFPKFKVKRSNGDIEDNWVMGIGMRNYWFKITKNYRLDIMVVKYDSDIEKYYPVIDLINIQDDSIENDQSKDGGNQSKKDNDQNEDDGIAEDNEHNDGVQENNKPKDNRNNQTE